MSTETQPPKLSLGQRLMADSPSFWKKISFIGLGLGAIVAGLQQNVPEFPKNWLALLAGLSVGMVALSQFAVKDTAIVDNPNATIQDYVTALGDIPKQYADIKSGIQQTVDAINSGAVKPAVPVSETPIVKEPVVADIPDVKVEIPIAEPIIDPAQRIPAPPADQAVIDATPPPPVAE